MENNLDNRTSSFSATDSNRAVTDSGSRSFDLNSFLAEDPMIIAGIALSAGYLIGAGRFNLVARTASHMLGSMGKFAFGYALESYKRKNSSGKTERAA